MQYEPIKASLNSYFTGGFLRRLFYWLLGLLLLRTWHVKRSLRKIKKIVPSDASVLDAGSGLGQYVWLMASGNRGWEITGVDIIKEQVEDCSRFFEKSGLSHRVKFREADLTEPPENDQYDLILSVDVMEHILEDEKVFRNFYYSMKDNGIVLISTPSDLGGSGTHHNDDESFVDEHVRNGYSKMEISEKLSRAGFKDINVRYTYGNAGRVSWHLSMKYPIVLLNLSKLNYIFLPLYYMLVLPVCLLLNCIDLYGENRSGTGLLVTARKHNV